MNVARRLMNYSELIEKIASRLRTDGIADMKGLRPSHGYTGAGRSLRLHARFGVWLGVDLWAWRHFGITPIRSELNTSASFSGVEGKIRQAEELFDEAHEDGGWLYVPIRLATGVERDRVIDSAVLQMRSIADQLLHEFPDD